MILENTGRDMARLRGLIRSVRPASWKQYKFHSRLADQLNRAGDSTFIGELHKCQEIQKIINEWSK